MRTRKQIIDEVASSYTLQNRALGETGCMYCTNEGRRCAVGRFMIDPPKDFHGGVIRLVAAALNTSVYSITFGMKTIYQVLEEKLVPEVRGNPLEFWSELQQLHDNMDNWTDTGLSVEGKEAVEKLHAVWDE